MGRIARSVATAALFAVFLCGASDAASKVSGEGDGEYWIERRFTHHEYIPYVTGTEFPRGVYRAITGVGDLYALVSAGRTDGAMRMPGLRAELNKPFGRSDISSFESRTMERADALLFCDFPPENTFVRSYVLYNYPYVDHHTHRFYFETPHTVVGFGSEASPRTGARGPLRIYIRRDEMARIVDKFSVSALVPATAGVDALALRAAAAVRAGNPSTEERRKFREWGGYAETNYSYVWNISGLPGGDGFDAGWWRMFDEELTSAIERATAEEMYFRNEKAVRDAQRYMKSVVKEVPAPAWLARANDGKVVVALESVLNYHMASVSTGKGVKDLFGMDSGRLGDYFVGMEGATKLWAAASARIASDVEAAKGNGSFAWGTARDWTPVAPWGGTSLDAAPSSMAGMWSILDREGGEYSLLFWTEDTAPLAHGIYAAAAYALYGKGLRPGGALETTSSDDEAYARATSAILAGAPDLRSRSGRERARDALAASSLTAGDLASLKEGSPLPRDVWKDVYSSASSPWRIMEKTFKDLYDAIVQWSSYKVSYAMFDVGAASDWNSARSFESRPTVVYAKRKSISEPVRMGKENIAAIKGVPAAWENKDTGFTALSVRKTSLAWNVEMDSRAEYSSGEVLARHARSVFVPVDLAAADKCAAAFASALKAPVPYVEPRVMLEHLFGAPSSLSAGGWGTGRWNTSAEETIRRVMALSPPNGWNKKLPLAPIPNTRSHGERVQEIE